jgi:ATP-binding cassette subfamily B protein
VAGGRHPGSIAISREEMRRRLDATSGRGRKVRGLLQLLRPYRTRVIGMLVALLLATAATLAPPPLAKLAIDDGIIPRDGGVLTLVVIAFVVSALVFWGASYLQTYLVGWVGQRALQDLRLRVFRHLQDLPVGFYERRQAGVLISRLTNDVQALDSLVTDSIVTLFQASLTLIGTIAILAYLDLELALLTFLIFPLLFAGSLAFRIASADAYAKTRVTIGSITAYLQETLSGIRVVRSFGQEPRHLARFAELNDDNRDANLKTVYLNAAYFPVVELVSRWRRSGILVYGGLQVIDGDVTVGVLVGFIAALNGSSTRSSSSPSSTPSTSRAWPRWTRSSSCSTRSPTSSTTRTPPTCRCRCAARSASRTSRSATARARSTSTRSRTSTSSSRPGRPSPSSARRARASRRSPSSSRASTTRPRAASSSTASTSGTPGPSRCAPSSGSSPRRRSCSAARSATTSPSAAPTRRTGRSGTPCAPSAPTTSSARCPRASDTEIGERGIQLSAGQRQLIAFARALIADPRILILDEATANVDLHTEGRIEAGMRRLLAGAPAIVIAHRLSTIRQAGRIVVLDGGRVIEQGTHDELIAAEGAYWRLYRDWAEQAAA